ncbi:MAG: hypothetical protein HW389_2623, partial [Bacteroidetes bacterium]|nr:hypothetical protein [Bacteroidota bacterium]
MIGQTISHYRIRGKLSGVSKQLTTCGERLPGQRKSSLRAG